MKSRLIIFTAALLAFFSCQKDPQEPIFLLETASSIDPEEYAVYNVFLSPKQGSPSQQVIIQETTESFIEDSDLDFFLSLAALQNIEEGLVEKHLENIKNHVYLGQDFDVVNREITLISNSEHDHYFADKNSKQGWEKFNSKYQNAGYTYLLITRVTFNQDKTQALVGGSYILKFGDDDQNKPIVVSNNILVYLEKENEEWKWVKSATSQQP